VASGVSVLGRPIRCEEILMRRLASYLTWLVWLTVCLSLLVLPAANAYIDPGSGSLIFQVVVGAAMAVSLGVKVFWRRITGFFSRRSR
jgi:hypothetical protein